MHLVVALGNCLPSRIRSRDTGEFGPVAGMTVGTINPAYGVGTAIPPDGAYGESWDEPGAGGIRLSWPLANLVNGATYQFEAFVSRVADDATLGLMIDVCDDEDGPIGVQGPFYLHSMINFTFTRTAWDSTYRFIDVWCGEYTGMNYGDWDLANIKLSRIA